MYWQRFRFKPDTRHNAWLFDMQLSIVHTQNNNFFKCENSLIFFFFSFIQKVENEQMQTNSIILPGVLKTGLPEISSYVQHIAGILSNHNLLLV